MMKARILPSIKPGTPWHEADIMHMGTRISPELVILHMTHPSEPMDHFILHNEVTGEMMRVEFTLFAE